MGEGQGEEEGEGLDEGELDPARPPPVSGLLLKYRDREVHVYIYKHDIETQRSPPRDINVYCTYSYIYNTSYVHVYMRLGISTRSGNRFGRRRGYRTCSNKYFSTILDSPFWRLGGGGARGNSHNR